METYREKSSGGWLTYAAGAYLDVAPPGSPTLSSAGTGYKSVELLHTAGWNTPNFHKRVSDGELIPMTAFSQYKIQGEGINEWDLYPNTWPASGTHEYTSGNGVVLDTWYASTELGLMGRANAYSTDVYVQAAAARLAAGSFDALTFLSELQKTITMFTNLGAKLLRMMNDPKVEWRRIVRSWSDKDKPGKAAADQWLEERYGWRTLMYDIEDFNDALKNLQSERNRRKERVGFRNVFTETSVTTASDARRDITRTALHEFEVSLRGNVVADIEPIRFQFNPLTTGWELIRFSFVIDWFLSVGAALGALSFLVLNSNYTAAGGIQIVDHCLFSQVTTAKAGHYFTLANGSVDSTSTFVRRTPCQVTTLPQFRLRLDVSKVVDLVALVVQAISRRK